MYFENRIEMGADGMSKAFIGACEKAFWSKAAQGVVAGYELINLRFVLDGGEIHDVDSSDFAFMAATEGVFTHFFPLATPVILEPWMDMEVTAPAESGKAILKSVADREGRVYDHTKTGDNCSVKGEVPLRCMFGYMGDLRGMTQGVGEYAMDFKEFLPVPPQEQEKLAAGFQAKNLFTLG